MSEDLDNTLRKALRRVDPGEDFTARVLARVAAEARSESSGDMRSANRSVSRLVWLPVALAASLVLAVVVTYEWQARRERAGLEARDQVIEALRVTSEKLDLAYQIVNNPPPSRTPDDAGA